MVVLAIGPDAQKPSYQKVLKELGGETCFQHMTMGHLSEHSAMPSTLSVVSCSCYYYLVLAK